MGPTLTAKIGESARFDRLRARKPSAEPIRRMRKAVVIEDNPLLLGIYLRRLAHLRDVEIPASATVRSLEEAAAVLQAHSPDIIITDLSLTSGCTEGFDVLAMARRELPGAKIVLTSLAYAPDRADSLSEQIRRAGFDAAFNKFDLDGVILFLETGVRIH